ncbi:hypothetical protein [Streptosporangium sp. NPDC049304]|uniref:hypothetical protein n=1 Tax=Streptosporangium sp. NPDC049304 TaxID=3154830 RepID=UPI003428E1EB
MDTTSPAPASMPSPSPAKTAQTYAPASGERCQARLSRWLPAAFVAVLTTATLLRYGVPAIDIALFTAYLTLGLALPGVLIIRATYPGDRTLAEEIALGTALGYALEIFTYIPARALGLPLLVLAWPVATYTLFLTVPRLRGHWKGRPHRAAPVRWSWALALTIACLTVWSALSHFRTHALTWPEAGTSFPDMPFHLALIGEARHHLPLTVPMVDGEPLFYHWFVYAHFASASWITGIDPLVLLLRLGMLPMLAAFVVLTGATGRRVTGSWAGGLLTVAATICAAFPSLYLGTNGPFSWGGVPDLAWTSPTQTFGALLFAPIALLFLDILEKRRRDGGRWLLLAIFLSAVMGAKATYLPLLGAGLSAVVVVEAIRRRRPPWSAAGMLAMTAGCFLFAQFVLFGGAKQGLGVDPFSFMRTIWRELTGLGDGAEPPPATVAGITLVCLLCWVVAWCGALGLLSRPRLLVRPGTILMLGIGAAGFGGTLLLGHPSRSQLFFLWGAYPYLACVTVHGTLVLLRRARISPRTAMCWAGAGAVAAYLIPLLCGVRVPLGPGLPDTLLYRPYLALLVVGLLLVAVLIPARGALRAWALVTVMLAGIGLPADLHARVLSVADRIAGGAAGNAAATVTEPREIPQGALEAGRWLRARSDPGDLIATNAHCRWGYESPCDSGQAWVAALSERHVLVEGWLYTATNLSRWHEGLLPERLPFWDEERIRSNDAAFGEPSAAAVRYLRERYGVRWLFVDERRTGPASGIGDFAELRFRSGDCAVYRIPDGSA